MKPYFPTSLRQAILQAADKGNDPFGLAPTHRDQTPRIRNAMTAGLTSPTSEGCWMMAEQLSKRFRDEVTGMDRLTADLVRGIGVEPLALVWMAHISPGGYAAIEDDGRGEKLRCDDRTEHDGSDCLTYVEIAPGVEWYAAGTLFMPEPPQTVVMAATGMMLRDLVRHPVLDEQPLRIVELSDEARIGTIGLVTDARNRPITVDELLAMALDRHTQGEDA